MLRAHPLPGGVCLTSDVLGRWGCRAFSKQSWFKVQWPEAIQQAHITVKEMVPIVLVAVVWGGRWSGKTMVVWCDNSTVVNTLNKGCCRDPDMMHLVMCLTLLRAKFQFTLTATYIEGMCKLDLFFSHLSLANPDPTPLPQELLDLTIIQKQDWTSLRWTELYFC